MEKTSPQVVGEKIGTSGDAEILEGFPVNYYKVINPLNETEKEIVEYLVFLGGAKKISSKEHKRAKKLLKKEFLDEFQQKVLAGITFSYGALKLINDEDFAELKQNLVFLFKNFVHEMKNAEFASEQILDRVFGYGSLGSVMRDNDLEEIMVNGPDMPVFVYHKKFGMCRTNLTLTSRNLVNLIQKIANTAGKIFDETTHYLDARLPGGDRANATASSITPNGISLTIRKFNDIPLSIIDLISNKTLSVEVAAFLWVMVEGLNISPKNIIISGGAGSGKTTTLNVLSSFVSHQERIITIEDPVELNLGNRENWVQMETRQSLPGRKDFLMDKLLRNSLRMRPDRLLVGEVRGPEAQTLFVAMDIGHEGSMGTVHANSAKETLIRLKESPMNVPEIMLPLLDIIIVQFRMYIRGKGIIRRMIQIAEVTQLEEKSLIANIFEWDRKEDKIKRTDIPSHLIEEFAHQTQTTKKDILKEINVRKKILEWLAAKNINSISEVEKIIQQYYYDPKSVLEMVVKDMRGQVASF